MVNAIALEVESRSKELNEPIETIYFGGGTPSLLESAHFEKIMGQVTANFHFTDLKEFTLEANPDDITLEKVQLWKSYGINRLSIGVQSFNEVDLRWMNRAHNAQQSIDSILLAQEAGISNLTIDLMYGLPDLSLERWKEHIQQAINLGVSHISAYCLTVEERTALYKKVQKEELIPADQDLQSEQFELLIEMLTANGFIHYEISNFGKPDFLAVHNTNYWKGKCYLGIGPSAHSYNGNQRLWNISNNHIYMNELEQGKLPLEIEELSPKNKFNELLLTGLRTMWGVDLSELNALFPISSLFQEKITQFGEKKWMEFRNNTIFLTKSGKHFADTISQDLFEV